MAIADADAEAEAEAEADVDVDAEGTGRETGGDWARKNEGGGRRGVGSSGRAGRVAPIALPTPIILALALALAPTPDAAREPDGGEGRMRDAKSGRDLGSSDGDDERFGGEDRWP